ncbi:hypothetical protein LCGC14_2211970 [marine sediment metagenome]|uniref:HTH luxR-type domain-containing protein n=1 Tax=marine sediment metagenome TaxID=412755 RepID=A0A0F9FR27_9ZZZZ
MSELTVREKEILAWIGGGASNREISDLLFISLHTVKTHVEHIMSKLEVRDRLQAALLFHHLPLQFSRQKVVRKKY